VRTVGGQKAKPAAARRGAARPPAPRNRGLARRSAGRLVAPGSPSGRMPAKAEKAGKPARTARGPADRSGGRSYARALDNSAPAGAARYGANASAYRLRLAASSALLKSLRPLATIRKRHDDN